MYWCKLRTLASATILGGMLLSTACRPDIKETGAALKYFDLKGFFIADTARLNKINKPVFKTVMHNGVSQSKNVNITNWGQELDLFISSDINKPAWNDSYTATTDGNFLIYRSKDPDLKTREILVKRDGQKVEYMVIYNHEKNILYQTTEKLTYFPDSLYQIEKKQSVRLLGTNKYLIKGVIGR